MYGMYVGMHYGCYLKYSLPILSALIPNTDKYSHYVTVALWLQQQVKQQQHNP